MTRAPKRRWLSFSISGLFSWTTFFALLVAIVTTRGIWQLIPGVSLMVLILVSLWLSPKPPNTNDIKWQIDN